MFACVRGVDGLPLKCGAVPSGTPEQRPHLFGPVEDVSRISIL